MSVEKGAKGFQVGAVHPGVWKLRHPSSSQEAAKLAFNGIVLLRL